MTVLTVSQVNTYIKALLDESAPLKNVFVVGEISNFVHYYRNGHMYFTLKDEKTQLKAVMFSSYSSLLKFRPENGMRVICRGRISVYEKDGIYQLYVEDLQPDGIGALNIAFEQLKSKLSDEGLFDDIYKKPIPKYPKKIGVVTSNIGAAVEDIKNILKRRYPVCEVVIVPTSVQGKQAAPDIVTSLKFIDSIVDIDLIIVGRGGGSMEDLWAFNTEEVARAVFSCKKPVISAVGHETDFTICDFVADLRAPTPSAAAELAVPDINGILENLSNISYQLHFLLKSKLESEQQRLDICSRPFSFQDRVSTLNRLRDDLDSLSNKMQYLFKNRLKKDCDMVANYAAQLNALSPLAVLARGYCIAMQDTVVVKSVKQLNPSDSFNLILKDGTAVCSVEEVIKNE